MKIQLFRFRLRAFSDNLPALQRDGSVTSAANQDQYVFDQSDDEQRATYVTDQLVTYNLAHSTALPGEHPDYLPLHLYVLDRAGTVVGGVLGRTHALPFWFEVGVLWVEERLRHHGLGRQLLER